ncbi:MAG: hypothetical protein AB9873_03195 [Syntrophobacteraceae bacterium]
MTSTPEELAQEIRAIYRSAPDNARERIEAHLLEKMPDTDPYGQLDLLEALRAQFTDLSGSEPVETSIEGAQFRMLLARVLGKHMDETVSTTDAMMDQLSASLNRIFDSVNEIVGVIQGTLMGEQDQLQTIRRLIHLDIQESRSTGAIEKYLSQIKHAFLLSNRAFHLAARSEIKKVLDELDPDRPVQAEEHGFKFGFLKKSDQMDAVRTRFDQIKRWFESDRFSEDLSREFERVCQKLYAEKGEASENLRRP